MKWARIVAESLLILGLEGSRDEKPALWVFNTAIQSMGVRRRSKWAAREVKACDVGSQSHGKHTCRISAPEYATESRCL
jgi:hypothetical protein